MISFQLDHTVDKTALLGQLKQLIIDERRQTNFGDENFDEETLVEQMEGKRLKIEDTNLIRYCDALRHIRFSFLTGFVVHFEISRFPGYFGF